MSNYDDNIPLLTDILQIGDQEMHHHFDAHQFDDQGNADSIQPIQFENASAPENTINEATAEEPPVIQMYMDGEEPIENELAEEDFSESMKSRIEELDSNLHTESTSNSDLPQQGLSHEELKEAVNQAIHDSLPHIEEALKETLYKKLGL